MLAKTLTKYLCCRMHSVNVFITEIENLAKHGGYVLGAEDLEKEPVGGFSRMIVQ